MEFARQQSADPMEHSATQQRPALLSLGRDPGEGALGHRRVMLQFHRRDPPTPGIVAHGADEAADAADVGSPRGQGGKLGADIEIRFLHAHRRHGVLL